MAFDRRQLVALVPSALIVGLLVAAAACSSNDDESDTYKKSERLESDGSVCRDLDLSVRTTPGASGVAAAKRHDEASFEPAFHLTVPETLELSEGGPHKRYTVALTLDAVTCTYEHLASAPTMVATLSSCSDGTIHAGSDSSASRVALDIVRGSPITVQLAIEEATPCAGTDAGAEAGGSDASGGDASTDAGVDAPIDTGVDAGPTCSAETCSTTDPCLSAACTSDGCNITPRLAGTVCGSAVDHCTTAPTCDGAGSCQPGSAITCPSAPTCSTAFCSPSSGCATEPTAAGTSCSADACHPAACNGLGACVAGALPPIDDLNPCTIDSCDPVLGVLHVPALAGTSCSDNLCLPAVCNGAGTCVATTPPAIDDGLACTQDSCDPVLGVVHTPLPSGTSCSSNACAPATCDSSGACVAGTPPVVDDGSPCTVDSCDPVLGVVHTPVAVGTSCSPNVCAPASCDPNGVCVPSAPPPLDDGDICTVDQCLPETGVTHTRIANCDSSPVKSSAPFETRASLIGRVVSAAGGAITGADFTVWDEMKGGTPRSDVVVSAAADGSFRLRLASFPTTEPARTPPHRVILQIEAAGTLGARREAYLHVGDAVDLGDIKLVPSDPAVTNIGPGGGTATDSRGLVEVVVPPGALATTVPIRITPLTQRDEFPAPLPDETATMYGVSFEPTGTTFAVPVTVRATNYRSLPTSLSIPVGAYNDVESRWDHAGIATWDGAKFAVKIDHFSWWDLNGARLGDLVAEFRKGANGDKGRANCGMGSSWRVGGGAMEQTFSTPSVHVRGEDIGFTLHYSSGLAGSRMLGTQPATTDLAVPHGSIAVSVAKAAVHTFCVPPGGSPPSSSTPGVCSSVIGTCGGSSGTINGNALGTGSQTQRSVQQAVADMEADGWFELPLDESGAALMASGYMPMNTSVFLGSAGGGTCTGQGGTFGATDLNAPRVQLPQTDDAPTAHMTRPVFVHHRFSSPMGSGWAIREVSRIFTSGDTATLVHGDGQIENFGPRATPTYLGLQGELAFARDESTGEIFAAGTGSVLRFDPATGANTTAVGGVGLPGERIHALAVARVAGTRHFVIAGDDQVVDLDEGGGRRVLTSRPNVGSTFSHQASLAARGDLLFYTSGGQSDAVLYRLRLSDPAPVPVAASAVTLGDVRLNPTAVLSGVQFSGPRGVAFAPDGSLFVAEPRRHVVYRIAPDPTGEIGPNSVVEVALGRGGGGFILQPGERYPAHLFPINQPTRLSVAPDGTVLVSSTFGVAALDPVAREAENIFYDAGHDEITTSIANMSSAFVEGFPASFVALSRWSLVGRVTGPGSGGSIAARVDVDPLSSERDPMRALTPLPGGGFELLDKSRAMDWRFDVQGRLVEDRKRTGEINFAVTYSDVRGDKIDHITDAVGGSWSFLYSNDKLSAIVDPSGRTTAVVINAQGDVERIVEPDGETHSFVYDKHHMTSKTSPRGDVTTYTYADDGTVATSTKPGNESYSFLASLSQDPTYDAQGRLIHAGRYIDARGVTHDFITNVFGDIEKETYVADGTTYVSQLVYAGDMARPGTATTFPEMYPRRNVMLRATQRTLNGVPLSPPVVFDSLGRLAWSARVGAQGQDHIVDLTYDADDWVASEYRGRAAVYTTYERDPAGHLLRAVERNAASGVATGFETDFTWRADGQPATMTAHHVTTTFSYDDAGSHNLLSAVDSVGRALVLGYDNHGNVTSTTDGTASASFVFDTNNRLVTSKDGFGNATDLRYTRADCGCSEEDEVTGVHTPDLAAGVEWTMDYGPQGRLASVTDPQGFVEKYEYEPTGELKKVTDRLNRVTTMSHDQLGRVLQVVDTLGRAHQRTYTIPTSGSWSGPTLTAGSNDATSASTSLTGSLRSGDYQIGLNAYDTEGFPAQISLYRDATFQLAYTSYFDAAKRLSLVSDRTTRSIADSSVPSRPDDGGFEFATYAYDRSDAPLVSFVNSPTPGRTANQDIRIGRNTDYDVVSAAGFSAGTEEAASYTDTVDTAGRVTAHTNRFRFDSWPATYGYYPDGRMSFSTGVDGVTSTTTITTGPAGSISFAYTPGKHEFTYDARGQLATLKAFEGTYTFTYDEMGRNKRIDYPDGHARVQTFDELGRIKSRCYTYGGSPADSCYYADYDPVGNPVGLADPDGEDIFEYDALDRLKKVTRNVGGSPFAVESYDYNALGALSVNQGAAVDHQRPRLDGGGLADAAVPNTLRGQPVVLDGAGRVTSLAGQTIAWDFSALPRSIGATTIDYDPYYRRIRTGDEYYIYEGQNRIAAISASSSHVPPGDVRHSFLYAGIDHPLRVSETALSIVQPTPDVTIETRTQFVRAYYEVDLAGNVRRLRAPGGTDLGGYRYSAFGQTLERTANAATNPLQWKGRWLDNYGGVDVYDMRARQWAPELGAFLSIDRFAFQDPSTTLWAWPGQNPIYRRDVTGRGGLAGAAIGAEVGLFVGAVVYTATAPSLSGEGLLTAAAEGAVVGGAIGFHPFAGVLAVGALTVESDRDLWKFGLVSPVAGPEAEAAEAAACPVEEASFGPSSAGAGQRSPRVVQTGGHTMSRNAAARLNEYAGSDLTRRDWGRALEALKAENGLPNNHQGRILDNGDYTDLDGNVIDNLLNYAHTK